MKGTQRSARIALAAALVYALFVQVLAWFLRKENPLSQVPIVDAKSYWDWAGRIAGGEMIGEHPFFSAPLYPYLLGALRWFGGGLEAGYLLNGLLWMLCIALIERVGTQRYGLWAGALGAWLFVLMLDPLASTGRVLAGSLQCVLTMLTLERADALRSSPSMARAGGLGLCVGLATLAWPVLLPAVFLLGLWAAISLRPRFLGTLVTIAGLLTIAPATLHNLAASGEWIPISAHGGVTFYHGNNEAATGVFSALGVSSKKEDHHLDALEQTRAARGLDADWSAVSSYFFERGIAWWMDAPKDAAALAATKLRYFLTGRHYGDIYPSVLERGEPFGKWMWFAPLPAASIIGLALVVLLLGLVRDPFRYGPDLLLVGAALGVCVVFWYTPRYRLPALPVMAMLAAWGLVQLRAWSQSPLRAGIMGLALGAGLLSGPINQLNGFDDATLQAGWFQLNLAQALRSQGDLLAAEERLRRASALGQKSAEIQLADLARERGEFDSALEDLARIADELPDDASAQRTFAVALAQSGQAAKAVPFFQRALAIDPNDWQNSSGLGTAQLQAGQIEEAYGPLQRAFELAPHQPQVAYLWAFVRARHGQLDAAMEGLRGLLDALPQHEDGRKLLVDLLRSLGRDAEAVEVLGQGLRENPEHVGMGFIYAWILATTQDEKLRDGVEALRVATGLCEGSAYQNAEMLDVRAAALAELDRFKEAVAELRAAIALLDPGADPALYNAMQARLHLFLEGKTYRE